MRTQKNEFRFRNQNPRKATQSWYKPHELVCNLGGKHLNLKIYLIK